MASSKIESLRIASDNGYTAKPPETLKCLCVDGDSGYTDGKIPIARLRSLDGDFVDFHRVNALLMFERVGGRNAQPNCLRIS
jgi:hypothetical protein